MNREYFEAISRTSLIDMTLLIQEEKDLYKEIVKDLSERTCESCKHLDIAVFNDNKRICLNIFSDMSDYTHSIEMTFGCNKWEKKQ